MSVSKMSPAVAEAIIESIREGNYVEPSAEAAGVSRATVFEWIRRGEGRDERTAEPEYVEFALAVRKAQAEAEKKMVKALAGGATDDWRAAEAWLKRARPDRWTERQQVDHTSGGKSIEQLFAATPLARTNTPLPEGSEAWEGTDG